MRRAKDSVCVSAPVFETWTGSYTKGKLTTLLSLSSIFIAGGIPKFHLTPHTRGVAHNNWRESPGDQPLLLFSCQVVVRVGHWIPQA